MVLRLSAFERCRPVDSFDEACTFVNPSRNVGPGPVPANSLIEEKPL